MAFPTSAVVILALAAGVMFYVSTLAETNILVDMNEHLVMGHVSLQAAFVGFCLNTGAIETLANKNDKSALDSHQQDLEDSDFLNEGNINEDEYTKQSIYSLLYGVYQDLGALTFHGESYQFTFNTWGLGGVYNEDGTKRGGARNAAGPYTENHLTSYPPTQAQRHGKTAYSSLLNFNTVKELFAKIKAEGRLANVVEIGSGTGAGANELTWLHPNVNYTAVDMQARGAKTCRDRHASSTSRFTAEISTAGGKTAATFGSDKRLNCLHANGQELKKHLPNGFADIVLISETHIADVIPLDQETKNVFDQVKRLLKPGGLFVWGNAIPTSIWEESFRYLAEDLGMEKKEIYDVTENAVLARDEDFHRVEHFYKNVDSTYYGLQMFPACSHAVGRLFLNFCRHPGTALYKRMLVNSNVTKPLPTDNKWCDRLGVPVSLCEDARVDSYVQMCYQKPL